MSNSPFLSPTREPAAVTRRRNGLSIMELVVVLMILAVLAGLVISVLPNLIERTHYAKCADTIAELNKAWMRAYALNVRYPDHYDSLLDESQAELPILPAGLRAQAEPTALEPGEVEALAAIGVRWVVDSLPGAVGTYDYAPLGATPRSLAQSPQVLALNLAAHEAEGNLLGLKRHLQRQPDGAYHDNRDNTRYVVFGIGPNCTGVGSGQVIQEAPVHFGASDALNPAVTYQRYLVVFSIVRDGNRFTAYFESAAGNDAAGPSSAEVHTQGFHEATSREG